MQTPGQLLCKVQNMFSLIRVKVRFLSRDTVGRNTNKKYAEIASFIVIFALVYEYI